MTGGFVLGEVLILQRGAALQMLAAGLPAAAAVLILFGKSREPKAGFLGSLQISGRSMWLWLLPVFLLAGGFRAWQGQSAFQKEISLNLDGERITVEGRVEKIVTKEEWLVLELGEAAVKKGPERAQGKILKRLQVYLEQRKNQKTPKAGQMILVSGDCSAFDRSRNPGEFDYQLYYCSLKLSYRIFAENWSVTGGRTDWYRQSLFYLSEKAGEVLDQAAGEDGGIFRALLLGDKSSLPEEVRSLYQKNGIAHLLAISGLHLSLVSMAVYGLLRKSGAGFGLAGICGTGVLVSYGILAGGSSSIVRALIMALCGYGAAFLGRTPDLLTSLALAALWLFWDSPFLVCQAGVQLSFGALLGIGAAAPGLAALWKGEQGDSQENVSGLCISGGMQLVTLPVILFHFFQYPLYGIFLNLITVPLMGLVVASGGAAILFGLVPGEGGAALPRFAAGGGRLILDWYAWCCRLFEQLPGSSLILGRPSFWQLGLYYGILSACLWMGKKRNGKKKSMVQKMLPAAAVFLLFPFPARGLTVTFLDVGQGDGICLQTRQGVILSDCGSSDQKNLGEYRLEPFLKSRGIGAVDYAIVSHGDQDHISGISWLLEQEDGVFIRKLVLPAAGKEDEACVRLAKQAALRGCQVFWMGRGDCLRMGNLSLTCLYPDGLEAGAPPETDRNEHSLVLWLDYGSFDMVFTGDMSQKGEQAILENRGVREQAEVLKAAHHGSRFSSSEAWLDALSPGQAVISCGEKNRYGHPHAEVLERLRKRGITVYETRSCGAVELYTDGKRMRWETWLK